MGPTFNTSSSTCLAPVEEHNELSAKIAAVGMLENLKDLRDTRVRVDQWNIISYHIALVGSRVKIKCQNDSESGFAQLRKVM